MDDIAISGQFDFYELRSPFEQFIRDGGYQVALDKVKFRSAHKRQVVTGLVVNEALRPTKEFVRGLKQLLRDCIEHGPAVTAVTEGTSPKGIRMRLQGRIEHIAQSDAKLARRLRGMMCAIDWRKLS